MTENSNRRRKKVGLFFGSFNPIHIGHLAIANYMAEFSDLNEVWFVISPHNPLKEKTGLLAEAHRYYMVQMAVEDDARFKASNVEFKLPKPSFTIDTLTYLSEAYPNLDFAIIMGADQLPSFHKWKNPESIIQNYARYVYPRPGISDAEYSKHINIIKIEAPVMEVSSSFIREAVRSKKDVRHFLPNGVFEYIKEMHYYETHV